MGNVIDIKDVSMRFIMEQERTNTLKEYMVKLVRRTLRFSGFEALSHVSFSIRPGESVALIGKNGSGKSTMLKIIAGVMDATEGTVSVNGSIAPLIELGAGFDPDLTGRENVFLNGALLGHRRKYMEENYDSIVEYSELEQFIDVPVRSYSSGMIARLAFSVATQVNPEVLIVDEVLSVGDAEFQAKSLSRMMDMMSGGTTVLFVSHSLEQIRKLCSRVVWLDHGEVRMIGDTKEVCDAYEQS